MAEFQEVMQQYNRMFEACKQGASVPVEASYANAVKQPDLFEEVVMSWAAKHPEPVYPTWGEWLMEQMVIAERMRPKYDYTNGEYTDELERTGEYIALDSEMKKQIPADIAEKLGLEPKEE